VFEQEELVLGDVREIRIEIMKLASNLEMVIRIKCTSEAVLDEDDIIIEPSSEVR